MKKILSIFVVVFSMAFVRAHCPLCTIGAGAAAAGAVWLGVSKVVVALFIGAFSMSMGLWFSRLIKKQYVHFQKTLITIAVFALTFFPLLPIFKAIGPLYLPFIGDYGVTYAINYSLISGLFGALLVFLSPTLSKKLTKIRNGKTISFQGVLITILTLIIAGGIIQLLV